jgi:hypothetical protein
MLLQVAPHQRAQTALAPVRRDPTDDLNSPKPVLSQTSVAHTLISEKQQLQFGLMTHDAFGAYSPQWTIPSSRQPQKALNERNPGPGQYEVPPPERDLRYPHVIGLRPPFEYSTLTSPVDLVRLPGMPERCPQTIGPLDGIRFFMPIPVSPPPGFNPPTFTPAKGVTIGPKRKEEPPNPAPGPGAYSPTPRFTSPHHGFPRMNERDIFRDIPDTPGPGAYETVPQLAAPPRWAGKLRIRTQKMKDREVQRKRPWSQVARQTPRLEKAK